MSRLKSPQALTGTLLKTVLSKHLNISPSQIWHLAIMPCFDKKLEASRAEFTDVAWSGKPDGEPVRDVDCVITSRELLMLADTRGIDMRRIPTHPLPSTHRTPFPDIRLSSFLFPRNSYSPRGAQSPDAGTSGGYLYHLLASQQRLNPGTQMMIQRGRNSDVVEYSLVDSEGNNIIKAARYYGFRNIQNLVRKLKPAKPSRLLGAAKKVPASESRAMSRRSVKAASAGTSTSLTDYAYVEVMACPGGCTNGGGQIRAEDAREAVSKPSIPSDADSGEQEEPEQQVAATPKPSEQRAWLAQVDAAYYRAGSEKETELEVLEEEPAALSVEDMLSYWTELTGVPLSKLTSTTYNAVEGDVGKKSKGDTARVAELAGKIGGGW
ncbi:histone methyltransferase set1 [Ascosphaera pollenicola]|nr:histone methyltransferase set1 [Ascosphaera pollenicola]